MSTFQEALARAKALSLTVLYTGCSVHVQAVISRVQGVPTITGYRLDDFCSDATVATIVNGEERP